MNKLMFKPRNFTQGIGVGIPKISAKVLEMDYHCIQVNDISCEAGFVCVYQKRE